ncbi:Rab5-interacting protein [Cryptosporidium felis]|nr:Rab5-interacting protein [Cryptosporidium felis]
MSNRKESLIKIVYNTVLNSRSFELFNKAVKVDSSSEWTKDEVSLITYWILQICALIIGTICGILCLKGVTVFISALLCLIFIGIMYVNYLDIPERILDPSEVVVENTVTCLVTFILSWITTFNLINC